MIARRVLSLVLLALVSASGPVARVQQSTAADRFTVSDAMIPMRDGVRLHVKIFTPKDQREPLPIIMKRTPYGVEGAAGNFTTYLKTLADEGYIFVFQDIRGKYGSEGTFVMQRPPRPVSDPKAIDEGTDTYDTIDWLLTNVPNNNGRVGMLGISYDGWTTIMGAIEPHPALKAISPQASPADMWLGDDFHHNGAFRLSYGFEYAAMMESGKDVQQFAFDRYDTFDWYLSLGPLANVNRKYLHERIPTWNDYVNHPDYDEFWKRQTMIPTIKDVKVPTLNVAGWWDQEDFYGPVRIYEELEKYDTKHLNYLVVGPWNHGGWSRGHRGDARADSVRQPDGAVLPRPGAGALVRALPEGQGHARSAGGPDVRGGEQPLAALGRVAAEAAHREAGAVFRSGRITGVRQAGVGGGKRPFRLRPRISRPVSATAHPGDVFSGRIQVVNLADGGPAVRG